MSLYSSPPNVNVVTGKTLFLHKDFIKNSNIDVQVEGRKFYIK